MGTIFPSPVCPPRLPWFCLAGQLRWCSTGSSDADRPQSRVGAWWSGLSHKEEKLFLPRQGHSGLLSLSPRQTGGTQPHPAAISARQRPITSRQRANSKHTWIKPDGSAWSPVAKVGVVIIPDMLKLWKVPCRRIHEQEGLNELHISWVQWCCPLGSFTAVKKHYCNYLNCLSSVSLSEPFARTICHLQIHLGSIRIVIIWITLSLSLCVSLVIDSQTDHISARLSIQSSGFYDILHFEGRTFGIVDRFRPVVQLNIVRVAVMFHGSAAVWLNLIQIKRCLLHP